MTAPVIINLEDAARNAVGGLVEKTGSSRDRLVSRPIETYAAVETWQLGKIKAGIVAAERGDFANDDEIRRVREKFAQP